MLPSKDRLRFREVEEVFKKGRRLASPLLSVTFVESKGKTAFAVTVSKKVARNATDRNKIRRRLYSILAKVEGSQKNIHAVFLPKRETLTVQFGVLKKETENLLARVNILR